MAKAETRGSVTRSDRRIPKLRARGRANRQSLLAEARRQLQARAGKPVSFSDVFEAAGVSRGSAYRIYDNLDDLLQDLAGSWIVNLVRHMRRANPDTPPETWQELSDHLVANAASYCADTAQTMRALPRIRSNAPPGYRSAVKELTGVIADAFDRYFDMPLISDWFSVLGMYTALGDTIFADAVRRDGTIAAQRLAEAQKICVTYLSFYLPDGLEAKGTIAQ